VAFFEEKKATAFMLFRFFPIIIGAEFDPMTIEN